MMKKGTKIKNIPVLSGVFRGAWENCPWQNLFGEQ